MAIGSIALFYSLIYRKETNSNLNSFTGGILALYAFLMTIIEVRFVDGQAELVASTTETSTTYNGVTLGSWVARFGGIGIFIAIITSILAVRLQL